MMGNEFGRGDFEKTSVLELIEVREMAKLLGEGTNVLICDVERGRGGCSRVDGEGDSFGE